MRRALAGALAAAIALASGCSSGTQIGARSAVTVYVSVPLHGPSAADGRDVADGARLALARAGGGVGDLDVRARYLDDTGGGRAGWSPAKVGENARRATEDSNSIAYIGDFESGATRVSEPITNLAQLLQVSPASSAVDLTRPFAGSQQLPDYEQGSDERTFGRVIPDDDAQGRAAGNWARRLEFKRVAVDRSSSGFSHSVEAGFKATAQGLVVSHGKPDAIFETAVAQHEPAAIYSGPAGFKGPVLGTDALIAPWSAGLTTRVDYATSAALDPSQLPPAGRKFIRDFRSRFHRAPGRYAAYGYEAMAIVLDSIDRAGAEGAQRQAVIDAFFDTLDRHSILGTYSIDDLGDTTLDRMTGYRVGADGRLRPVAVLPG